MTPELTQQLWGADLATQVFQPPRREKAFPLTRRSDYSAIFD